MLQMSLTKTTSVRDDERPDYRVAALAGQVGYCFRSSVFIVFFVVIIVCNNTCLTAMSWGNR